MIWKGYIRSILEYALVAWWPLIDGQVKDGMEKLIRKAARAVTGCTIFTRNEVVLKEAGIQKMEDRFVLKELLFEEKRSRLPKMAPINLGETLQLSDQTKQILTSEGWPEIGKARLPISDRLAPWEHLHQSKVIWDTTLQGRVEGLARPQKYDVSLRYHTALEDYDVEIWTDASVRDPQGWTCGIGLVERAGRDASIPVKTAAIKMQGDSQIFCAELHAIRLALEKVERHGGYEKVLIVTDCKSAIDAIQANTLSQDCRVVIDITRRIRELLQTGVHQLRVMWIPSHCGIELNEKANQLAVRALDNVVALTTQITFPTVKQHVMAKWKEGLLTSWRRDMDNRVDKKRWHQHWYAQHDKPGVRRQWRNLSAPGWIEKAITQMRVGKFWLTDEMTSLAQKRPIRSCPRCKRAPDTISHFLTRCQDLDDIRQSAFGQEAITTAVLYKELAKVALYLKLYQDSGRPMTMEKGKYKLTERQTSDVEAIQGLQKYVAMILLQEWEEPPRRVAVPQPFLSHDREQNRRDMVRAVRARGRGEVIEVLRSTGDWEKGIIKEVGLSMIKVSLNDGRVKDVPEENIVDYLRPSPLQIALQRMSRIWASLGVVVNEDGMITSVRKGSWASKAGICRGWVVLDCSWSTGTWSMQEGADKVAGNWMLVDRHYTALKSRILQDMERVKAKPPGGLRGNLVEMIESGEWEEALGLCTQWRKKFPPTWAFEGYKGERRPKKQLDMTHVALYDGTQWDGTVGEFYCEQQKKGQWVFKARERTTNERMSLWRERSQIRLEKIWKESHTAIKGWLPWDMSVGIESWRTKWGSRDHSDWPAILQMLVNLWAKVSRIELDVIRALDKDMEWVLSHYERLAHDVSSDQAYDREVRYRWNRRHRNKEALEWCVQLIRSYARRQERLSLPYAGYEKKEVQRAIEVSGGGNEQLREAIRATEGEVPQLLPYQREALAQEMMTGMGELRAKMWLERHKRLEEIWMKVHWGPPEVEFVRNQRSWIRSSELPFRTKYESRPLAQEVTQRLPMERRRFWQNQELDVPVSRHEITMALCLLYREHNSPVRLFTEKGVIAQEKAESAMQLIMACNWSLEDLVTLVAISAVSTVTEVIEPSLKEDIRTWLRAAFDTTSARIFSKVGSLRSLTTETDAPSDTSASDDMGEIYRKREPHLEDKIQLIQEAVCAIPKPAMSRVKVLLAQGDQQKKTTPDEDLEKGHKVKLNKRGLERFAEREGPQLPGHLRPGETGIVVRVWKTEGKLVGAVRAPRGAQHTYWQTELSIVGRQEQEKSQCGPGIEGTGVDCAGQESSETSEGPPTPPHGRARQSKQPRQKKKRPQDAPKNKGRSRMHAGRGAEGRFRKEEVMTETCNWKEGGLRDLEGGTREKTPPNKALLSGSVIQNSGLETPGPRPLLKNEGPGPRTAEHSSTPLSTEGVLKELSHRHHRSVEDAAVLAPQDIRGVEEEKAGSSPEHRAARPRASD